MSLMSSNSRLMAGHSEQAILSAVLRGLGLVVALLGIALGLLRLYEDSTAGAANQAMNQAANVLASLAVILGGVAAGVVLWAAAAIVRYTFRSTLLLRRTEHGIDRLADQIELAAGSPAPAAAAARSDDRVGEQVMSDQEMIDLLREISENTLLSESDRAAKRQRVGEDDRRRRLEAVEDLIRGGAWSAARRAVAELIKRYPDAPEGRQAHDRVEQAAAQAEQQDLKNTRARVEELMSISSWDRAVELAEETVGKHPTSVKARQLLDRVQRERRLFQQDQVTRLVLDIERAVDRHRYREALSLATSFVDTYPDTPQAANLRSQLEALRNNAEVEERKQLEAEIKQLVHRKRIEEALDLATKVIDTYPTSPQAKVLREQLPRLREMASQQSADREQVQSRIRP
jgi:hypothetical protein